MSMGKWLNEEKFKREVRYGKYWVDFANDLNRVIEIDGRQWHMDVVADFDRDIYLREKPHNCQIMRVKAVRLWNDKDRVQREVLKFLTN